MTKLEQLRKARADRAAKLADDDKKIRQEESKERDKARKAHNRRCYTVGAMVAAVGLFKFEDEEIGKLLTLLKSVVPFPDPAARLEEALLQSFTLQYGGYQEEEDEVEVG